VRAGQLQTNALERLVVRTPDTRVPIYTLHIEFIYLYLRLNATAVCKYIISKYTDDNNDDDDDDSER